MRFQAGKFLISVWWFSAAVDANRTRRARWTAKRRVESSIHGEVQKRHSKKSSKGSTFPSPTGIEAGVPTPTTFFFPTPTTDVDDDIGPTTPTIIPAPLPTAVPIPQTPQPNPVNFPSSEFFQPSSALAPHLKTSSPVTGGVSAAPTITHPSCEAARNGEIYVTEDSIKVTYFYELLTNTNQLLRPVANTLDKSFQGFLASTLVDCSLAQRSIIQGISPADTDKNAGGTCNGISLYDRNTMSCYVMEGSVEVYLNGISTSTSLEIRDLVWSTLRNAINGGERRHLLTSFINEEVGIIDLFFVSDERLESEESATGNSAQVDSAVQAESSGSSNGTDPVLSASFVGISMFVIGLLGFAFLRRIREDDEHSSFLKQATTFETTDSAWGGFESQYSPASFRGQPETPLSSSDFSDEFTPTPSSPSSFGAYDFDSIEMEDSQSCAHSQAGQSMTSETYEIHTQVSGLAVKSAASISARSYRGTPDSYTRDSAVSPESHTANMRTSNTANTRTSNSTNTRTNNTLTSLSSHSNKPSNSASSSIVTSTTQKSQSISGASWNLSLQGQRQNLSGSSSLPASSQSFLTSSSQSAVGWISRERMEKSRGRSQTPARDRSRTRSSSHTPSRTFDSKTSQTPSRNASTQIQAGQSLTLITDDTCMQGSGPVLNSAASICARSFWGSPDSYKTPARDRSRSRGSSQPSSRTSDNQKSRTPSRREHAPNHSVTDRSRTPGSRRFHTPFRTPDIRKSQTPRRKAHGSTCSVVDSSRTPRSLRTYTPGHLSTGGTKVLSVSPEASQYSHLSCDVRIYPEFQADTVKF